MPVDTIRNTSQAWPYTLPLAGILLLQGCVSGTWWYATAKSGPGAIFRRPVPGTMNGWHHVASFSETSTALSASIFDQKNYGARTDTARGHSFRLLRHILTPTENAPLARKQKS